MQTFYVSTEYSETAKCLDRSRLGKQRVEAYQIANTLLGYSDGWAAHPAVEMWDLYEVELCYYGIAMCNEWMKRGYKDNLKFQFELMLMVLTRRGATRERPNWHFDLRVINSHQSNLLRKNPEWYSKFNWGVSNDLPYYWPTQH